MQICSEIISHYYIFDGDKKAVDELHFVKDKKENFYLKEIKREFTGSICTMYRLKIITHPLPD
jgi:uncharacterized membrane protein